MIQIYTGKGKGKTTAAIGLAIRAAGSGQKVFFAQVLKDGISSEVEILENIPKITVQAFGDGKRVTPGEENQKEKEDIQKALEFITACVQNFQVVIVDELVTAMSLGLLPEADVLKFMAGFPPEKELIITGRGAKKKMIEMANLVTEMKPVKHYYDAGVKARKGIEF